MVHTTSFSIVLLPCIDYFFFFNDTATTEIYTLSLHDALPISHRQPLRRRGRGDHEREHEQDADDLDCLRRRQREQRSEEHTSELQSLRHLVCRLLLEKKKKKRICRECP